MVERIYLWSWDARPYPAFPQLLDVWSDGANHATGHWLTGRLGAMASDELMRAIGADYGVAFEAVEPLPPLIHGYVLEAPMTARQALEPIISATGASLRAGPEGLSIGMPEDGAVAVTELVAGDGPLLRRRHPDAGEAVARVALAYADRERDFQTGAVTALLDGAGALEPLAVPLVLDAGGARRVAEQRLAERSAQRETVEFALPPSAMALETGDCVSLDGAVYEISEIRDGLTRRIVARALLPKLDIVLEGGREPPTGTSTPARSVPLVYAAHLPPLSDDPVSSRLAIGAYASPWPSEVSVTDDISGAALLSLARPAALGVLLEPLHGGSIFMWDTHNAVELELASGHLADRDDDEVLAGANRIAVLTDSGSWEIIGFAGAELVAPKTYRLTRLLRRQGGSDHATGPASTGQPVMVLDGHVGTSRVPSEWLGSAVNLRCYAGRTDAEGVLAEADASIDPVLPLRPVHLAANRLDNGDIVLRWVRRSRADADSWATEDAPLEHQPEAYSVTIHDGPMLARSIEAADPEVVYSLAEQTADFGGPATGFVWKVAQRSAVYGTGHWAEDVADA